ncbi:MAG: hypothetical protein V1911_03295 [Candidatus Micrarchaeota archaeon]
MQKEIPKSFYINKAGNLEIELHGMNPETRSGSLKVEIRDIPKEGEVRAIAKYGKRRIEVGGAGYRTDGAGNRVVSTISVNKGFENLGIAKIIQGVAGARGKGELTRVGDVGNMRARSVLKSLGYKMDYNHEMGEKPWASHETMKQKESWKKDAPRSLRNKFRIKRR